MATSGPPSNRLPWIALAAGVLIVLIAIGVFLFNRRTSTVELTTEPSPVARSASVSASPPATLVPPTLPTSAAVGSPQPSPTPVPAPTPSPVPTAAPPTPAPPTPAPPPPAPAATLAAAPATSPVAAGAAPTSAPALTEASPAALAPTPFSGQVSNSGGLGNTRADLDAAYGTPAGETPQQLVAYRTGTVEFHVQFVPDINGRAALIAALPQGNAPPMTLDAARAEAKKLLPKDAQPPNQTPEGNAQFAVERFTSQSLAAVLPEAQSGQLLAVYALDGSGRITRIVVGAGNDPNALLNAGQ